MNNEEKYILAYLEGEIKYNRRSGTIEVNDKVIALMPSFIFDIDVNKMGKFIAQLLINERERRKEQEKEQSLIKQMMLEFEEIKKTKCKSLQEVIFFDGILSIIESKYLIIPKKEEE